LRPQGTDDATRHSLADTERVANGQHMVAHGQGIGVAQHDHGQLVEFDLEDGQVRVRVGANDLGLGPAAVVEDHLDLVCAFHNVIVGEDVAGGD
jgi:hypothetical protein